MPRKVKPPNLSLSPRGGKVELDWRAYFIEFCRVHGEPIEIGGRLVFRDGWTYSSTSYEGPENPPPPNNIELDELVLAYWTQRATALGKMMGDLLHQRKMLQKEQAHRSLPLQQVTIVEEEDRKRRSYKQIDLQGLEVRINWLADDLKECEERLTEIAKFYKEQRDVG